MFRRILYRTILWELLRVFSLSLFGITGMLLMAGIVAEATQRGLSFTQILAIIPLLIPSTLPYTLPATTLFATCVVYGRLAHDNEILAIKAAGINILSVLWPAIALGIAISTLTMVLYWSVIPTTRYLTRIIVLQDIEEFLYAALKRDRCVNHPKLNYTISVQSVHGRTLKDAIFERKDPKTGQVDVTARADEAELEVDLERKVIRIHARRCKVIATVDGSTGQDASPTYEIPLPPDFDKAARKFKASDMTWGELFVNRGELVVEKERTDAQLAIETSRNGAAPPSADTSAHMQHLRNISRQKMGEIRGIDTELWMRPALSLGCLCFVVIGCPVGIWFSRSDYLSAFITCFLPIVIFYYPLLLCGANLSKNGSASTIAATWSANLLLAIVAVPLYRKLLQH